MPKENLTTLWSPVNQPLQCDCVTSPSFYIVLKIHLTQLQFPHYLSLVYKIISALDDTKWHSSNKWKMLEHKADSYNDKLPLCGDTWHFPSNQKEVALISAGDFSLPDKKNTNIPNVDVRNSDNDTWTSNIDERLLRTQAWSFPSRKGWWYCFKMAFSFNTIRKRFLIVRTVKEK